MKVVLDVENTVTRRDGKLHLDPFESTNTLVMVGVQSKAKSLSILLLITRSTTASMSIENKIAIPCKKY